MTRGRLGKIFSKRKRPGDYGPATGEILKQGGGAGEESEGEKRDREEQELLLEVNGWLSKEKKKITTTKKNTRNKRGAKKWSCQLSAK